MKKILSTVFALVLFFGTINIADARSGCCSHHNGVCGCSCCDGTSLSDTCSPYYPECNSGYNYQAPAPVIYKTPAPKPVVKKTCAFTECCLEKSSDKYQYKQNGYAFYDNKCTIWNDAKTELWIFNNGLAKTQKDIHRLAYFLLKYKNDVK